MRILLDVLDDNPQLLSRLDVAGIEFFASFVAFIEQRLSVLRELIDFEEAQFENPDELPFVKVYLLDEEGTKIAFTGYSAELSKKMQSCISFDDLLYISDELERQIQSRHN